MAAELFLVFDTSAFLYFEESQRTGLSPADPREASLAVQLLRKFDSKDFGTLPKLRVGIPDVVQSELDFQSRLVYNSGDASDYKLVRKRHHAQQAVSYLESPYVILTHALGIIVTQKRTNRPCPRDRRGGQILMYCSELMAKYDPKELWLITNDRQLAARAVRSGYQAMTLYGLNEATLMYEGTARNMGSNSFIEKKTKPGPGITGRVAWKSFIFGVLLAMLAVWLFSTSTPVPRRLDSVTVSDLYDRYDCSVMDVHPELKYRSSLTGKTIYGVDFECR